MSASSVDKRHKKHKKTKDSPPEVDRQGSEDEKPRKSKKVKADKTTSNASTPAVVDVIESISEPAKEMARKKRKKTDGEGASESLQGVEDSGPKKKKKKHRNEEEAMEQVNGLQAAEDDFGKKKKKKKRRESSTTENGERGDQGEKGSGDEGANDHRTDVKPSLTKKEKKEKKRKQLDDEGDKAKPKEKSRKKRKHSSSSGFPNPSEDESLNDQARKALEYAFAQFEDSDSWKFHKARQNWLLRNIWSDEAVPEKYIPLATRYLQGVQGGARENLIKSCREALEPSKPTTANAEIAEQEIPPESSETDDTAKRTVRFTVDDKEDDNTVASPTQNTKRLRAESLLTALTS